MTIVGVGRLATYAASLAGQTVSGPLDPAHLKGWGPIGYNYGQVGSALEKTQIELAVTASGTAPYPPK